MTTKRVPQKWSTSIQNEGLHTKIMQDRDFLIFILLKINDKNKTKKKLETLCDKRSLSLYGQGVFSHMKCSSHRTLENISAHSLHVYCQFLCALGWNL